MSGPRSCPDHVCAYRKLVEELSTKGKIAELLDRLVRVEQELEADRYEFEKLVEWALEAGSSPEHVFAQLAPHTQVVLREVAHEFGFVLPDLSETRTSLTLPRLSRLPRLNPNVPPCL